MKMDAVNAGKWNDEKCSSARKFVCYTYRDDSLDAPEPTNSPNNCPKGYYSWNQECYLLVDEAKSFSDAKSYCKQQSNYANLSVSYFAILWNILDKYTDLVSIEHIYENEFLHSIFWRVLQTGQTIWLGMEFSAQDIDGNSAQIDYNDYDSSIEYPNVYIKLIIFTAFKISTLFKFKTGMTRNVSFTWIDGWPIYYTNWAVNEPNQDHMDTGSGCVFMNK